ncbi:hypothetical protein C1H69_17070 [Billgrantia endophytica]|uniref:Uncharacterized protein n=1 Tax=Billgrantia endophytica TaxID=2033802 RepID=A0A2N7TZB4_9GAMM|nr:hypothetical protein C1H69_17070 [Halomonas endophytica]
MCLRNLTRDIQQYFVADVTGGLYQHDIRFGMAPFLALITGQALQYMIVVTWPAALVSVFVTSFAGIRPVTRVIAPCASLAVAQPVRVTAIDPALVLFATALPFLPLAGALAWVTRLRGLGQNRRGSQYRAHSSSAGYHGKHHG